MPKIEQNKMDEQMKKDIKIVLEYLWFDEQKHYESQPSRDHIFFVLKRLARVVNYEP